MEQFKLLHLQIDAPRCQIKNQDNITSVEPRSMAVLVYLAARPKQVISQQELFDALWPATVFNPAAIQRCIAQLRKAMGDDARSPVFIATHSKRGYSLEVLTTTEVQPKPIANFKLWLGAAIVAGLAIWMSMVQSKDESPVFSGQLTPITSTSYYDFMPVYSSDANTLAFIRQKDGRGYIYLKDLISGTERQLSQQADDYSSLAWSVDNSSLFYIVNEQGAQKVGQIVIEQAQASELFRLEETGDIWRVLPVKQGVYYMLANVPLNQKPDTDIKFYDFKTKVHSQVLASSTDFTPYRITLSPDRNALAIAGENRENKVEFRLFELNAQQLSNAFASLPLGFTEINWHPNGQSLLVHHLNQLYSLTLDGKFTQLPYKHFQRLFNPTYHPDGHSILMSVTEYDTDIMQFNAKTQELHKLIDSDGQDHLARFSPNAQQLAFVSSRSGKQELYLWQQGKELRLFNNPDNLPIYRAPVWSKRGDKIAFSFANWLFIYNLNSQSLNQIKMVETFTSVLDWYKDEDQLLIATKKDNVSYFSNYRLDTHETIDLLESGVNYSAKLAAKDELVFFKQGLLHYRDKKFNLPAVPEITGSVFPVNDKVIFVAGRSIYQFDGEIFSLLLNALPVEVQAMADVIDEQTFVFYSNSTQSAKIVALQ